MKNNRDKKVDLSLTETEAGISRSLDPISWFSNLKRLAVALAIQIFSCQNQEVNLT